MPAPYMGGKCRCPLVVPPPFWGSPWVAFGPSGGFFLARGRCSAVPRMPSQIMSGRGFRVRDASGPPKCSHAVARRTPNPVRYSHGESAPRTSFCLHLRPGSMQKE